MKTQQLPKNWKEVELGELGEIVTGNTPPMKNSENYGGETPWIKPPNLDKTKYLFESETYLSKVGVKKARLLPKGSVLVSCIGNIGKVAIAGTELCTNQQINSIIPNKEVLSEFLFFVIQKNQKRLEARSSKAVVPLLNKTEFSKVKVLFPFTPEGKLDLPTQKAIVSILEKAEALKQKRKKADELADEYLKAVFYEMFLKDKEKFEEIELGDKKICEISGEYGSGAGARNYDGRIRYIRITDIDENGNLKKELVSPSIIEEKYFLKQGDLLFARSGATVGKTYLHSSDKINYQYAGYLIRYRFNEKIIPTYVYYFTKTPLYWGWINSRQKTVAQPNINAKQYSSLKIPLPPLPLQQKFADIVEKVEKIKEKQRQSRADLDEMFNALMQKAFSGELV
jgi:type I restriction enzyme, S subunit